MTEHEVHLPFMVDVCELARVWGVSTTTINRLIAAGRFPIPVCRLSERINRCKRTEVEAYFDAPLSEIMPWLIAQKEPA